jgi:hypothetical protein
LPTLSINNISGIWTPALNNTETTTYTFTPNEDQCANIATLTIEVNPIAESNFPTFDTVEEICVGEEIDELPTTSENGIVGTWSPALDNTQTTEYTFTPDDGQCAANTSITISVNSIENPIGEATQLVNLGATLEDIEIAPATITWYATLQDALDNVNSLLPTTQLENNSTYYAVNDNGQCRSEPFAVTVFLSLSIENSEFMRLNYYPNPVANTLFISNTEPIKEVTVYNLMGQILIQNQVNESEFSLDLNELPQSIYIVKLETEKQKTNFQVVKR